MNLHRISNVHQLSENVHRAMLIGSTEGPLHVSNNCSSSQLVLPSNHVVVVLDGHLLVQQAEAVQLGSFGCIFDVHSRLIPAFDDPDC